MKLAIGVLIGIGYLVVAGLALRTSAGGWRSGHPDIGFWWAVIGSLLGIAGLSAVVGSVMHGRRTPE